MATSLVAMYGSYIVDLLLCERGRQNPPLRRPGGPGAATQNRAALVSVPPESDGRKAGDVLSSVEPYGRVRHACIG